jgi:hypothetical protein
VCLLRASGDGVLICNATAVVAHGALGARLGMGGGGARGGAADAGLAETLLLGELQGLQAAHGHGR